MSSPIERRVTRSMAKNTTQEPQVSSKTQSSPSNPLYIYKDPNTGVEFLTKEQCQMRGITKCIYNKDGILCSLCAYLQQTKIHPMYRNNLSPEQRANPDLLALAPPGFVWKEDPSCTSYYSWDEPYRLVKNPYI
jgi:hypothetical protein